MMTDPIADFLIQIKNGYMAQKESVSLPHSGIKEQIAHLLTKEGYLTDVKIVSKADSALKDLVVQLRYVDRQPRIQEVIRVSKPGRRTYVVAQNIPNVLNGLGLVILSTSQGIMTGKEARNKGVGGEVLCKIW